MYLVAFRPLTRLLYFILYFACISTAFGEGTKQWSPSASDYNYLKVNSAGGYAFGGYGLPEAKRLHIHIEDPSTEVVHLGFSWMVNEPANTDITTAYQFRIISPSGGIVHGPFTMSTPNITSHSQAVAGPSTINPGGYTTGGMWTFSPSTSGDHYIEFATAGSIRWFDITVADSGGAIDGRIWSRAWTARADNGYSTIADAFDTPFNGALVAYDGLYATKIDFNGSGIRPLEGQFSFNPTGTANTGNEENDRKSVAGSNAGNPSHKIFLNTPDTSVYPMGAQGQLQNLPLKVNSSTSPNIPIEVTQAGKIELLMNLGGGTKDRRLFADVVAGVNPVPWDGLNGEGLQMQPHDFPIPVTIAYTQGETHFTAYDVEGLDNGFQVYTNTSTSTIGPRLQFWDDSNITAAPGTPDAQVNVDTGAATRRRWSNTAYGDLNTLNTWWYAYRDAQSTTILLPGDYGDAPSAYDSPMHEVPDIPLVYLGAVSPDKENSPIAPFDGTGDDITGTADEDAVVGSLENLIITETSYDLSVACVGEGATVAGWIDFNNNQSFDAAERVATTCLSGNADLNWSGLSGLSVSNTFLRLRIASVAADVSSPSSAAADGEVEDYPLTIIAVMDDHSDAPADGSLAPSGVNVTAYGDATHTIDSNLQLGAAIDSDNGSIASANAAGDGIDDDGVSLLGKLTDLSRTYSVQSTVTNQTGNTARLVAWIDFDGNGTFDPDEAAIRNVPSGTTNGTVTLSWSNIPLDIQVSDSFLRLRLTTDSLTNREPNGAKNDGEVEDYPIAIVSTGVTVSGRVYIDANNNANVETGELGISNTVVVLHDLFAGTCRSMSTTGNGDYHFVGVPAGGYEVYQAHGESTPTPQSCGTAFSNNPIGYQSTTPDVLFATIVSADLPDQDFGEVGTGITFEPHHQGEILPGNTVFYTHIFSTEAGGSVRFMAAGSDNAVSGWTQVLYRDIDCDGTLNGAEGNVSISAMNFGLSAGNRLCIINKVYAPANVPAQDRYEVKTTATFTFTNSLIAPVALTVTDLTIAGQTAAPTVGESRLALTKSVQNLSQVPLPPESETVNQAFPGDVLMYRIYYQNTGTGPITDLTVNDTVPVYTGLVMGSSACDNTPVGMSCTPNINNDALNWSFTGSLIGGAKGHVSYQTKVDN